MLHRAGVIEARAFQDADGRRPIGYSSFPRITPGLGILALSCGSIFAARFYAQRKFLMVAMVEDFPAPGASMGSRRRRFFGAFAATK